MNNKTIWKFELEPFGEVLMPVGSEILHVAAQGDTACLWALVDPAAEKEPRGFIVAGTGHPLPDMAMEYVGTFHLYGGALVFHVFELEKDG